jgi:hypothetical protein
MRRALFALLLFAGPAAAAAQDLAAPACQPLSPTQVVMVMADGTKVRGTLLCLGTQEVQVAAAGTVTRRPLVEIARIDKPRDRALDGFLKGAAIGLVGWAVFCPRCEAEYMLRSTLGYAFIGLALDALQTNTTTIYRGTAPVQLAWRIRF